MVAVDHEHWYRYVVVWVFVVHHRKSEGMASCEYHAMTNLYMYMYVHCEYNI